jgi:hypothetical protein
MVMHVAMLTSKFHNMGNYSFHFKLEQFLDNVLVCSPVGLIHNGALNGNRVRCSRLVMSRLTDSHDL